MIPISSALPDFLNKKPKRIFRLGRYVAGLFEDLSPIADRSATLGFGDLYHYLYAMVVYKTDDSDTGLAYVVTLERQGDALRAMLQGASTPFEMESSDIPSLCAFDETGHVNFGQSAEWVDVENFTKQALQLICERFGLKQSDITEAYARHGKFGVADGKKGGSWGLPEVKGREKRFSLTSFWTRKIVILAATVCVLMVLFPPWRTAYFGEAVGYSFILTPPKHVSVTIDLALLLRQVMLVSIVSFFAILVVGSRAAVGELDAATNALLAEHLLRHVEFRPADSFARDLRDTIIRLWREMGSRNISDANIIEQFNQLDRFKQLNVLAIALYELGRKPLLSGEEWKPVRRPLLRAKADASKEIEFVSRQLSKKHRVHIQLPDEKFSLNEKGIEDTAKTF